MPDKQPRFTPLSKDELAARDDELLLRFDVAQRWKCSEKSVERAETRLGLQPIRVLRAVRYRLSDVLRIEREGVARLPKKWTGVRPSEKAQLQRAREEEELAQQTALPVKRRTSPVQTPSA